MRPTTLLLWLAFALALLTIAAVAWREPVRGVTLLEVVPWIWAALAVALAADWGVTRGSRGLGVEASAPLEVFAGERAHLRFRLTGPLPQSPITLRIDVPPILDGEADRAIEGDTARFDLFARRRGVAEIEAVWASWRSRLGLFEFVPRLPVSLTFNVVPNIRAVRSGAVELMIREALFGEKQTAYRGEGSEFHQLSEFTFGMDTRMIDWKSTARHRELLVREMRAERNHPVVIALDNGHLMREEIDGSPKIDHQIRAALALAWGVIQSGDLVGLFAFDARPREWLPPQGGRRAFATIRSLVAKLDYQSIETNHTLAMTTLGSRLSRRGLVVVFSDFVDTTTAELLVENAAVLSKRHVVVFVAISDPELKRTATAPASDLQDVARAVSAAQMLADRQAVFERLGRLGVEVVEALPGQLVSDVLRAYLRIKVKEAI